MGTRGGALIEQKKQRKPEKLGRKRDFLEVAWNAKKL